MDRNPIADQHMRYLLSLLTVLVYRALGSRMTIDHLSDVAGKKLKLRMRIDEAHDSVTLWVEKQQ